MSLWIDGLPRPDHGPGYIQRVCRDCGATWVGQADDPCAYCEHAEARRRADERRLLLDPPWLKTSAGDPRYDQLDDVDKAVWDRTRGQNRREGSLAMWAARLGRAVQTGLITQPEMDRALRKAPRGGSHL